MNFFSDFFIFEQQMPRLVYTEYTRRLRESKIMQGFRVCRRPDGLISAVLFDFAPETVEKYQQTIMDYARRYAGLYLPWLLDLRRARGFNSYALRRFREMRATAKPSARFAVAILLDQSSTSRLLYVIYKSFEWGANVRVFFDEHEAVAWLMSYDQMVALDSSLTP